MNEYRIQLVMALMVGMSGICGCKNPSEEVRANAEVEKMVASFHSAKLESDEAIQRVVDNAVKSERAILFINVDWALMEPQKNRFADFAFTYHKDDSKEFVHFHFVDFTSSSNNYHQLLP